MYQFKPATERIQQQRELIRDRVVRYDAERARIMTEAYQKYEHVIPIIKRPLALYELCRQMTILVEDFELIVGNKGPNYFSSPAYPEWGTTDWVVDEVAGGSWKLNEDGLYLNPPEDGIKYSISKEDFEYLASVKEYWKDRKVGTMADAWKPDGFDELARLNVSSYVPQGGMGLISLPAGHLIAGYRKIINVGYGAIRKQAQDWIDAHRGNLMGEDLNKYMFYKSAVITCDAATLLVKRYSEKCAQKAAECADPARKAELEKFAGARATYSMEAMMHDGKALQAGTSHNFGDNFARAFDIQFLDKDGKQKYVEETSWGVSTRLIGAIIMVHGDDRGLVLPPRVAPIQAVVLPIAAHKPGVAEKAQEVADALKAAGLRVFLDDRDTYSAGWKFNEWEMKGVPARVEVGPRDIENGVVTVCRRDTLEKVQLPIDSVGERVAALMDEIHDGLFQKALAFRDSHIQDVTNMEELGEAVQHGFARAMWCGDDACELEVKNRFNAKTRNMPFDQTPIGDTCVVCGKKATKLIYFGKQY